MPTDHTNTLRRLGGSLAGVTLIASLAFSTGCGGKEKAAAEAKAKAEAEAAEQLAKDKEADAKNLQQLALGMLMYSGDWGGFFPFEAAILADLGTLNAGKVWVSPGFDPATPVPATAADIRAGKTDYVYIGSGLKDDNDLATRVVIMHTRDGAFDGKWINVLFIDGHVEGVAAATIKEAAEKKSGWQVGK